MRWFLVAVMVFSHVPPLVAQTALCASDLAKAGQLVNDVQARESEFTANGIAKNCALLRRNRADMIVATEIMQRCLTGHDRGENVGQMTDSLGDVDTILASKCR